MSAMRSFSQIPVRSKFFITTGTNVQVTEATDYDDPALMFPGGYPGPTLLNGSIGNITLPVVTPGTLLKDMGRSTTVVDAAGNHLAVYREVQRVNGSGSEGVGAAGLNEGAYGTFFVKVWSADNSAPNNVIVARLG